MEFLPKPKEVKLLTGEHALCYDGRIVREEKRPVQLYWDWMRR